MTLSYAVLENSLFSLALRKEEATITWWHLYQMFTHERWWRYSILKFVFFSFSDFFKIFLRFFLLVFGSCQRESRNFLSWKFVHGPN